MNITIEKSLKDALQPELSALNAELLSLAKNTDGFLGDLLSYVLLGSGKRVRPALVFLASQLGAPNRQHVRIVESTVELIHVATLIHDDVIDQAAMRRNQATVYEQHGVDAAVLLGDHVYTMAFARLAQIGDPRLVQLLADSTATVTRGEIDQLKKRYEFTLSEADYLEFIRKKTASLFSASSCSGAILAKAPKEIEQALSQYGEHLGIAFQISDDLLDITGEELVVGKTLGTDIKNGKMTLPLIHYRDTVSSSEKSAFVQELKSPTLQTSELIDRIKKAGSLDYAESVVLQHIAEAEKAVSILPSGDVKNLLLLLAQTLQKRSA